MAIQIIAAPGADPLFTGIFFPTSNLTAGGISSDAEFAANVPAATKRDKGVFAVLYAITNGLAQLDAQDRLGMAVNTPNLLANAVSFSLNFQRYATEDVENNACFGPLPVPTAGANLGRGAVALQDFFPLVSVEFPGTPTTTAGILIEIEPLLQWGSPDWGGLDFSADNRATIYALFKYFATDTVNLPTRNAQNASAVTSRAVGTSSEIPLPASYIAATDPVTGLNPAKAAITHILQSGNISIGFDTAKTIASDGAQLWDINSVTA